LLHRHLSPPFVNEGKDQRSGRVPECPRAFSSARRIR
jgi:hypothetical protein